MRNSDLLNSVEWVLELIECTCLKFNWLLNWLWIGINWFILFNVNISVVVDLKKWICVSQGLNKPDYRRLMDINSRDAKFTVWHAKW